MADSKKSRSVLKVTDFEKNHLPSDFNVEVEVSEVIIEKNT